MLQSPQKSCQLRFDAGRVTKLTFLCLSVIPTGWAKGWWLHVGDPVYHGFGHAVLCVDWPATAPDCPDAVVETPRHPAPNILQ